MNRRQYLISAGMAGSIAFAGCLGSDGDELRLLEGSDFPGDGWELEDEFGPEIIEGSDDAEGKSFNKEYTANGEQLSLGGFTFIMTFDSEDEAAQFFDETGDFSGEDLATDLGDKSEGGFFVNNVLEADARVQIDNQIAEVSMDGDWSADNPPFEMDLTVLTELLDQMIV